MIVLMRETIVVLERKMSSNRYGQTCFDYNVFSLVDDARNRGQVLGKRYRGDTRKNFILQQVVSSSATSSMTYSFLLLKVVKVEQ